jgi:hypothetical protein
MTARADLPRRLPRRAVLALGALALAPLLASCASEPPPESFPPLSFAYLPKLRLYVSKVDVEDAWTPKPIANGEHVEDQAPETPAAALRQMALDRLIPVGSGGHAVLTIDDASLTRITDRFECDLAVHLDISSADGTRTGYAEARVARTRTITDYSPPAVRRALYELLKGAMNDMNVEFEYQVRRSLRDWLQTDSIEGAVPAPVQQQPLPSPEPGASAKQP